VTEAATAHCVKLIISIPLETASQHFTLHKITTFPEHITFDKSVQYSVEHSYLSIQTSQRYYILFSETDFSKFSKDDIVIYVQLTRQYTVHRHYVVYLVYTLFHATTFVKESYYFTTKPLRYIIHYGSSFSDAATPDVVLSEISRPLVPL